MKNYLVTSNQCIYKSTGNSIEFHKIFRFHVETVQDRERTSPSRIKVSRHKSVYQSIKWKAYPRFGDLAKRQIWLNSHSEWHTSRVMASFFIPLNGSVSLSTKRNKISKSDFATYMNERTFRTTSGSEIFEVNERITEFLFFSSPSSTSTTMHL